MRPIDGWPGYFVTDKGEVYSDRAGNLTKLKFYSHARDGHWRIGLRRPGRGPGRRAKFFVHVLVLEAFVRPRPPGLVCRHLNGDPKDNRVENLCWGTRAENEADKKRHGTNLSTLGERAFGAKLTSGKVLEIRAKAKAGARVVDLAKEYGLHKSHIAMVIKRKRWAWVA